MMITLFQPENPTPRWEHLKGILLLLISLVFAHLAYLWAEHNNDWMEYAFAFLYFIVLVHAFTKKIILSFEVNQFNQTLTVHYFRLLTTSSSIIIPFENLRYQFTTTNKGSKNESWYFSINQKKWRVVAVSEGQDGFDKELLMSLESKLDILTNSKLQKPE
ncbi:MAG TPA: hypothetical protein PLK63_07550 [Catalimonadaceae bacterium]|mgnify:CR=1 FL=1|nr:hypothetical protein [Catalimonadaceae bacterium]